MTEQIRKFWFLLLIGFIVCPSLAVMARQNDLPNAGNDIDLCAEDTQYRLEANAPSSGGVGTWLVISKPSGALDPVFSDINDPQATVSQLLFAAGNEASATYELSWNIQYAGEAVLVDTMQITRWKTPSDANAGTDIVLACEASALTLAGNVPSIGQGQWALVSGTATIADPASPNTSVSGLGYGENILAWTISNGPTCTPSVSNTTITRYARPVADAGEAVLEVCLTDGSASLAGNDPELQAGMMTGKWRFIDGPTALAISNETAYNTSVAFTQAGIYQLRWEVTSGTCGTATDALQIKVFTPPVSEAGDKIEICETLGFGILNGNNPASIDALAKGRWRQLEGDLPISFTDSTVYNTSFTWQGAGTYHLQWAVSNGACEEETDEVEVIVYNQPQAEAGQAVVSCLPTGPAILGGNNPAALQETAMGTWTQASGPGTMVFADEAQYNTEITWDRIGVYKLYWTVSNGICGQALDSVLASVGQAPVIDAGADLEFCFEDISNTPRLQGNDPNEFNANGQWSQKSGPGTIVFNDPTRYNTSIRWSQAGVYELEWRIFNACNNVADVMTLSIYEVPSVADAGNNFQACQEPVLMNAIPPIVGQGTWQALGMGTIQTSNDPKAIVEGLTQGNHQFRWTVRNGVCPSTSDLVTVNYQPQPDFNIRLQNNACFGDSLGEINITVSGTSPNLQYILNNGASQNEGLFSELPSGKYQLRAMADNGCIYNFNNLSIESPEQLQAQGIDDFERPTGASTADGSLTLLPANGGVAPYQYSLNGGEAFSNDLTFQNIEAGIYKLWVKDANGCLDSTEVELPNRAVVAVFNAFSPNNDNINDEWNMPFLEDYPNAVVQVFNVWGEKLYQSEGTYQAWDGTYKGPKVAAGTYYYVIDLKNGESLYKGTVLVMY